MYQKLSLHNYQLPYLSREGKQEQRRLRTLAGKKSNAISETGWPHIFDGDTSPETHTSIASATVLPPSDLAYVVFTSGTTSRPKGVEVQYSALLAQAMTLKEQYELNESSRLLNTLPLHHVDGFIQGPIIAWYSGASPISPMWFLHSKPCLLLKQHLSRTHSHMIAVPNAVVNYSLGTRMGRTLPVRTSNSWSLMDMSYRCGSRLRKSFIHVLLTCMD